MFIVVSIFGWMAWQRSRNSTVQVAVVPHWASKRTVVLLGLSLVVGTLLLTPLFRALGSFEPVWADACHVRQGPGLDRILADLGCRR